MVWLPLTLSVVMAVQSPYAELTDRPLKALSAEEVEGLLAGHGMGMALPAELNHFPGPKHVLELRAELALSDAQARKSHEIFLEMERDAKRLGAELVAAERKLDRLFATAEIDDDTLRTLVRQAAELRGELRFAHLRAHLRMRELLDAEQVRRYDALRGYGGHGVDAEDCPHRSGEPSD